MKLNNKEIMIPMYEEQSLDNEKVIFIEKQHKIIVLNQTAATIWDYITTCYEKGKDISLIEIAERITCIYKVESDCNLSILCDIEEVINLLFQSRLLIEV